MAKGQSSTGPEPSSGSFLFLNKLNLQESASTIYGSNNDLADLLREKRGGRKTRFITTYSKAEFVPHVLLGHRRSG